MTPSSRQPWMGYAGVIFALLLVGWSGIFFYSQGILQDETLWVWLLGPLAILVGAWAVARGRRHREGEPKRNFGSAMRDHGTLLAVASVGTFGGVSGLLQWASGQGSFFLWGSAIQLWLSGALMAYGLVRFAAWRANPSKVSQ